MPLLVCMQKGGHMNSIEIVECKTEFGNTILTSKRFKEKVGLNEQDNLVLGNIYVNKNDGLKVQLKECHLLILSDDLVEINKC
jgi:hypothetical protein